MNVQINPNSIEALRSVRRMEIKSKSDFCGGFFEDIGPAVLGGSEAVPDPHFNRISIIESERIDASFLGHCIRKLPVGTPAFIDVLHPVSDTIEELIAANGWHPTGESRSSMLLTDYQEAPDDMEGLEISEVNPETLEAFIDLFLRGFDTPEELIPLATSIMGDLIPKYCGPNHFRLYLGTFHGEPACTEYLYFAGDEGAECADKGQNQYRVVADKFGDTGNIHAGLPPGKHQFCESFSLNPCCRKLRASCRSTAGCENH